MNYYWVFNYLMLSDVVNRWQHEFVFTLPHATGLYYVFFLVFQLEYIIYV